MSHIDQELPGIFEALQETRSSRPLSALENATLKTVEALESMQLLEARHHAVVTLAVELAATIDATRNARNPRASAIAMLVREYRETLEALPVPQAANTEKFDQFLRELQAAGQ